MKKKQIVTAVALAMGLAGGAFAAETVKIPVLPAPTLMDGELTEMSWTRAIRSPSFARLEVGQQPLDKTEAYVYRSEERLYIGVRAEFGDLRGQ